MSEQELYHTHIESKQKLLSFNYKEIWKYKDLIWLFTKRSFVVKYKQTILGPIWLFLSPFITSVMYTLVFGTIAGLSTNGVPQLLFYLGSNAVWSYFSGNVTTISGTFTANSNIFGKVYFPRMTMPISSVLNSILNFFIQFIMFAIFWIYYIVVGAVTVRWAMIPLFLLVLLQLGALGLGTGIIISSLTTKYRDLSIIVSFGISLWMYGTPVVYPFSQINNSTLNLLVHLNPASMGVETFRYIFLGVGDISAFWWIITCITTVVILFIGVILFNRVERTFMDTI